jgi:hypothetical protein
MNNLSQFNLATGTTDSFPTATEFTSNSRAQFCTNFAATIVVGGVIERPTIKSNVSFLGVNDVLCGRGNAVNSHLGNIRFREMVKKHRNRYHAASRVEKPAVAHQMAMEWKSQEPAGRFLSKPSGSKLEGSNYAEWQEINDKEATRKVAQRLREMKPASTPLRDFEVQTKSKGLLDGYLSPSSVCDMELRENHENSSVPKADSFLYSMYAEVSQQTDSMAMPYILPLTQDISNPAAITSHKPLELEMNVFGKTINSITDDDSYPLDEVADDEYVVAAEVNDYRNRLGFVCCRGEQGFSSE